ncbi:hypothetical protein [Pedobacter jeongneungensis]|uniref:hypothetical protein n=1 Tax=Pedobacter jeongneungensis TaxID=947309 RepID=UPI000469B059|nr:hypothetical protein [Pedobacter jeongneungensis]
MKGILFYLIYGKNANKEHAKTLKNLRPLILGFVTLTFAIYLLVDILFSRNLLKETNGILDYSTVDIETRIVQRSRSSIVDTTKFAVLRFKLKNDGQSFEISQRLEMIHDSRNELNGVNDALKTSKNLNLLLKKSLLSDDVNVYQINADGLIIYDNTEDANNTSFLLFFLSIVSSIFFFALYFWPDNGQRFNKRQIKRK